MANSLLCLEKRQQQAQRALFLTCWSYCFVRGKQVLSLDLLPELLPRQQGQLLLQPHPVLLLLPKPLAT